MVLFPARCFLSAIGPWRWRHCAVSKRYTTNALQRSAASWQKKGMPWYVIIFITAFILALRLQVSYPVYTGSSFSLVLKGTSVNLTIHVHPVSKLKIRGAVVPFSINVSVPWLHLGILYFICFSIQYYRSTLLNGLAIQGQIKELLVNNEL